MENNIAQDSQDARELINYQNTINNKANNGYVYGNQRRAAAEILAAFKHYPAVYLAAQMQPKSDLFPIFLNFIQLLK